MDELIAKIMQTPSIQSAITDGFYTAAEAEAEFRDQIKTGDTKNGLLWVEDLPEDVRKAIE